MATRRKVVKKASAGKVVVKKASAGKVVARKAPAKKPVARKGGLPARALPVARLAGVGSDAVLKATGKAWDQWLRLLDRAGAQKMPHKAIAEMVYEKWNVPPWWGQMVTVGYEQARGLRAINQKADGYAANASRTVNAALDKLYGAWSDPKLREIWLPSAPLKVRRSSEGKSMRITWTLGDSSVEVNFYPVGPGKSKVQVQHGKLEDAKEVQAQKKYWSEGLERLKAALETVR